MKTAIINLKSDPKLKAQASKLAKEMGMNLSQVIHISLMNFVQSGTITATKPSQMSARLERSLGAIEKDIESGKNMSPAFNNVDDMKKWLNTKPKK
jgi:addiction module RelB/DinJ family antitoxin